MNRFSDIRFALDGISNEAYDMTNQLSGIRHFCDDMADEVYPEILPSPKDYYEQYRTLRSLTANTPEVKKYVMPKLLHGVAPSIKSLQQTNLREVVQKMNFIHYGRVLFVQTVKFLPHREVGGEGVEVMVKDGSNGLIRLLIYNYVPEDVEPESLLPIGTLLAVLCPYPRKRDKMIILRCDNPECVVRYHTRADWEIEQVGRDIAFQASGVDVNSVSSEELKVKGNGKFKVKDYSGSIYWYKKALEQADDLQAAKILCNLSAASFELGKFGIAENYAVRALLKDKKYTKARYRQGRALLWLQRPQEAINVLKPCDTQDKTIKDLLMTCVVALEEMKGHFNIKSMISEVRDVKNGNFSKPFPFHADFESPKVAVGVSLDDDGHRGCKALPPLEEGELLIASRAFAYVFGEHFIDAPSTVDVSRGQDLRASSVALRRMAITKLCNNNNLGGGFYKLLDGTGIQWGETNSVNLQRITGIAATNSFGHELVTGDLNVRRSAERYKLQRPLTIEEMAEDQRLLEIHGQVYSGLWLKESMFNHSCTPNCDVFVVGPHMLIYATKRIEAGDELCISYCSSDLSFSERKERFADWYAQGKGFTCHCDYCKLLRSNSKLRQMQAAAIAAFKDAARDVTLNRTSMAHAGEKALPTSKRYSIFQAHKNLDLRFQLSVALSEVMDGTVKASRGDCIGALKSYERAAQINYARRGIGCLSDGTFLKDLCRIAGASLACNKHQRAFEVLSEVWSKYYGRFYSEGEYFILLVIKYSLPWWSDDKEGAHNHAYQLRKMAEKVIIGKKTNKGSRKKKCRGRK